MRSILALTAIVAAACASHPTDNTPRQVKVDASNIVEVQGAGYTIVDKNGQKLYCTRERRTGSHIQMTTTCLTEQEWLQVRDASQRSTQAISSQIPPPQGR